MGSDPVKSRSQQNLEAFQSTLPGWGATLRGVVPYLTCYTFQSTLPGWGATIESTGNATDVMIFQSTLPGWGATHNSSLGMVANSQFQSTLPGWGATEARHPTRSPVRYFNPRSPDGERRFARECRSQTFLFQSTLPGWGATHLVGYLRFLLYISIHAPRMGSDTGVYRVTPVRWTYFNPRSPDGERQNSKRYNIMQKNFNPRSPDGERPHSDHRILLARDNFNPRSPDGERLCGTMNTPSKKQDFNPRSPDGERQTQLYLTTTTHTFQSTLPGWGATCGKKITLQRAFISIHAPRMGSDSWKCRP